MKATDFDKEKDSKKLHNLTEAKDKPKVDKPQVDKPQNGIAGLKYWKQDMLAGLVVALVSVPLSLGIAIASGAPPICGITSEIIAGLVFPFIGGAFVTVSGPAAGLAPVIYSTILALGHGDLLTGYHRVICVIALVGVLQIIMTFLKAAKFSHLFPSAAIQGMLTSIGLMLIVKQIPNFIGHKYITHEFFDMVAETPSEIVHMNWTVLGISTLCLVTLFVLTKKINSNWTKMIPPQLLIVLIGVGLAYFTHLDPKFLVKAPCNPFEHGIIFPDFSALLRESQIWTTAISAVLLLAFVDGTESLATIHAVDRLDPFRRKSNPDRTLFAMGISNICSSLIGGLTIIPGIIKSTTCIVTGGVTAWVNFYNALFLILFLVFGSNLINLIPLGALSAVLIHIGYKLAGPHKWQYIASVGKEQLVIYLVTILVTLKTDLLIGIFAGMVTKFFILIFFAYRCQKHKRANTISFFNTIKSLFKSPISNVQISNNILHIDIDGPMTCFNTLSLRSIIDKIPEHVKTLQINLSPKVTIIDHSINLYLASIKKDFEHEGNTFQIEGLDRFQSCSCESSSLKYHETEAIVGT